MNQTFPPDRATTNERKLPMRNVREFVHYAHPGESIEDAAAAAVAAGKKAIAHGNEIHAVTEETEDGTAATVATGIPSVFLLSVANCPVDALPGYVAPEPEPETTAEPAAADEPAAESLALETAEAAPEVSEPVDEPIEDDDKPKQPEGHESAAAEDATKSEPAEETAA